MVPTPARSPSEAPAAVTAWRPAVAGIREVFHARFPAHAYPPHTHDTWTLFVVDEGAVRYDLHRRDHVARPTMVTALPPGVVHDGRPATSDGYAMRVLYVEPEVLGEAAVGAAVDRPVVTVPGLPSDLDRLHTSLACPDDALEAETRFDLVVDAVRSVLLGGAEGTEPTRARDADGLRAVLDEHLAEPITLAAAAAMIGGSPTGLARAFTAAFGVAPHAYLLGRRLDAARERIVGGAPIADVAVELGFADQAHLTRRFRQWYGTTPGALRGGRGRRRGRGDGAGGDRSARGRRLWG